MTLDKGARERFAAPGRPAALLEVLAVSFKLGLTSFGGPIAHLGYFHNEYVRKRNWLDEKQYADLVALCQLLPGPASSQVGIGIGTMRAGLLGGALAWIGFTAPSAVALVLFALLLRDCPIGQAGWIHGLKLVAVAIVAQAVLSMGQKLAQGKSRATIAVVAAGLALVRQTAYSQALLIAAAGALGYVLFRRHSEPQPAGDSRVPVGKTTGVISLALFGLLLVGLPYVRQWVAGSWIAMLDSCYRAGALVFGGGHVVLPLLQREAVPAGWVSNEAFLAGYGLAQAVPGPLFTFAGYLGALGGGISGAAIALIGIFLPAFLLVVGALPFWDKLRSDARIQGVLTGVNAAVVGILLAALYDPLFTTAVGSGCDFALAALLFLLLAFWKLPPWLVVAIGAAGGAAIQAFA